MKKLYSLLTLIVCLLCSTPGAKAVDYTTIPSSATAISSLETGTYVIKVWTKGVERYLYHDETTTGNNNGVFKLSTSGVTDETTVTDLRYLWKVTVKSTSTTDNVTTLTLTLQNEDSSFYPYIESGNTKVNTSKLSSNTTIATFTTEALPGSEEQLANSTMLYYTNSSDTKYYLISNGSDNNPLSLDYWENGNKALSSSNMTAVLAFYKVSDVDADVLIAANSLESVTATSTTGYVGDYTQDYINAATQINAAVTALSTYTTSGTSDDYTSLKSAVEAIPTISATKIAVEDGKYYQIKMRKDERAYVTSDALRAGTDGTLSTFTVQHPASPTEINKIWKFVASGSGYLIKSANAGDSYCLQSSGNALGTTETVWTPQDGQTVPYQLIVTGGSTSLNAKYVDGNVDSEDMQTWNPTDGLTDDCSNYYIIPVKSVTLSIGATGWASICYPFPVTKPEGLTVYTVSAEKDTYVSLSEYEDKTIPANTGFFVTGTANTNYTMTITSESSTVESGLVGTTLQRTGFAQDAYYALAASDGKAVLMLNEASVDVPANKAYLVNSKANSTRELSLDLGEATGISHITTPATDSETFYDLQGRRVLYPVHGIFVKSNGQKVYIK